MNWATSPGGTLVDGTVPALDTLISVVRTPRRPRTFVEIIPPDRPAHQWLRLAELDLFEPPAAGKRLETAADLTHAWRYITAALAQLRKPRSVTLFVLNRLDQLRDGLLRLVDGILTALRFALILLLAAFAHSPDVQSFVLVLVSTFRHYGHLSEPDDHALAAYRWMSVIGGEPVLSC